MQKENKTNPTFPKEIYRNARKGDFKPLSISRLPKGSIVEVNEDDYKTFMGEPSTKEAISKDVVIKKIKRGNYDI